MLTGLPNTFSHQVAREHGLSDRRLRALLEEGALERLGHGLYRKADAPPRDTDLIELAMRAPDATLCLVSALAHHDLTDIIPAAMEVALPRTARPPRVSAQVRWHRFQPDTFHVGRKTIVVDQGLELGVYDPERTIIDAFRLRHHEGEDLAIDALRRWLRRRGANPNRLLTMAKSFPKAQPELLRVLRVLG